jgi:hypothetical protein
VRLSLSLSSLVKNVEELSGIVRAAAAEDDRE